MNIYFLIVKKGTSFVLEVPFKTFYVVVIRFILLLWHL